jgi:hypothetical protein
VGRREALSSFEVVEMSGELPEVVLKESVNWTNITFKGRGFAWVNHPENRAMIKAHHDERDALLATEPAVYEAGWTTNSSAWVRVRPRARPTPTRSSSSSRSLAHDRDQARDQGPRRGPRPLVDERLQAPQTG